MGKPVYLYVTPFFPSPTNWRGGYCLDAVKALMRTGLYDVRVLVPSGQADYAYDGVRVSCFPRKALPFGLAPFLLHHCNVKSFLRKVASMGIAWSDVAVCHVHVMECAPYAVAAKRQNPRLRALLHHHSIGMVNLRSGRLGIVPLHASLLYFYYRYLCERMDAHVFVSQRSRESFACRFQTTPESAFIDIKSDLWLGRLLRSIRCTRAIVFYNGYDKVRYCPPCRPVSSRPFVIGCVANFQPMKAHLTLLKAIARVQGCCPGLQVQLVGSGETESACRQFVADHGLSEVVHFVSEMPHVHMPEFYRGLSLFVLPSRLEGFCCSYVEAAACGVPIIGCRGVSVQEMIPANRQHDFLVPPTDDEALARLIKRHYQQRIPFAFNQPMDTDTLWTAFLQEI